MRFQQCNILAVLADPCQTPESLSCACEALSRHDESPELFGFDLMFLSSMCDVSRRCSELLLALGCIHPLVCLLAHGCEGVRCGACRALLQLCKYALHAYCIPLAYLLH